MTDVPPATGDAAHPGLLGAAVEDNARWVATVARTHGVTGRVRDGMWASASPTPTGYPEVVTLRPGLPAAEVLRALPTTSGSDLSPLSVKDSHADVDLSTEGFGLLFDASWIGQPVREAAAGDQWWPVRTAAQLRAWQLLWSGGQPGGPLRPELLTVAGVLVLGRGDPAAPTAGAVLTTWQPAPAPVGLSNVTWVDGRSDWPGLLAAVREHRPGRPVVGYETGVALAAALAAGFEPLGPLRVWLQR